MINQFYGQGRHMQLCPDNYITQYPLGKKQQICNQKQLNPSKNQLMQKRDLYCLMKPGNQRDGSIYYCIEGLKWLCLSFSLYFLPLFLSVFLIISLFVFTPVSDRLSLPKIQVCPGRLRPTASDLQYNGRRNSCLPISPYQSYGTALIKFC
jgi:hypothetical protein